MGKSPQKITNDKLIHRQEAHEKEDERYRPFLIHSTSYIQLTDQILSLMPSDRNVLLSMNEYVLSEINPAHPNNINSPTHVILFCIRFITEEIFQPIGGLLIYKNEDQGALLAECVKAYINDLWKMGLCVVGTISPPLEIFRTIMGRLLNVENMNTYSDVIIYSVAPFKEIVHIYDTRFLLIKFQNVFKEGGIRFTEGKREFFASWDDMEPVMNIKSKGNTLSNYVTVNYNIHGKAEIFTKDIFENFLEVEAEGVLSEHAGGCAVLLNSIRNFIQYIELESINLKAMHDIDCYDNLVDILQGMTFQQNKKPTCTKEDPTIVNRLINPTTRRKLDFVSVNRDCLVQGYSVKEINNFEYVEYTDVILNKKQHQHSKGSIEIKQEIGNYSFSSKKDFSDKDSEVIIIDSSKIDKLHLINSEKINGNTNLENFKCDGQEMYPIQNKSHKTDNFDNKNCDNNNNGSKNLDVKENNTMVKDTCDIRIIKSKKHKKKIKKNNFNIDFKETHNFIEHTKNNKIDSCSRPTEVVNTKCDLKKLGNAKPDNLDSLANFFSQSVEETEKCITKSCDSVPKIVERLSTENELSGDFEQNTISFDFICTVLGMKRLIQNLVKRRVKVAKRNAFLVEHIDYFVSVIKSTINLIGPGDYVGPKYEFLNSEIAFITLQKNNGLYLVSK